MVGVVPQSPSTEAEITATLRDLLATTKQPRIVASGNGAIPWELVRLIDATLPTYRLNILNAFPGLPWREGVVHETSFVGAGMRKSPGLAYVPARLSLVPRLFRRALFPDVVLLHTSAPVNGKVSMGIEVNVLPGAVEACKHRGGLVIAQVNPRMPYTFGDGEIAVEDLDAMIHVDSPVAMPARTDAPVDEVAQQIGEYCANRISSGATLQMGIGAVPDATLPRLTKLRGLGIWSEMFSDGLLTLQSSGALDPDRYVVASFAMGSEELLQWMHMNPQLRMVRTEVTNDPPRISRQPLMTSINTALQVDLFDQANASRINARIHSGFGGQTDFVVGAVHARGGQSMMALKSWHPKANVSTIVPLIDEPVTSFQHTAVITENGIAELYGRSEKEQAAALIENAAHPKVRDELWEEAAELGLA
ncbi:MAG: acetyl-CoA hydrolase/transferase C-terminal domain-containing protein [Dermatophilaceae bacterium]|jgi:acyl-CoA hydrolase|nr:acetyl-CoA hydrolase [Candidatus Lutibacillus vidarii]HON73738.1 acetyl-CoA hydrolase/transferase C-terminal domain-containing protein [Dermatophilaceae bacterium]HRB99344.1 acetyl-CoA hydrolase/transferase C-terminal domain-containing protein [Dermatophilaceae bacterium]